MTIIDCDDFLPTSDAEEHALKGRLLHRALSLGPFVGAMMQGIWMDSIHSTVSQTQRLFSLASLHGHTRLDAACRRALYYRTTHLFVVQEILRKDAQSLPLNPYTDVFGHLRPEQLISPGSQSLPPKQAPSAPEPP